MNFKDQLCFIFLVLSFAAATSVSSGARSEQKLIMVQGTESQFMKGEDVPVLNFNKKEMLPYLLNRGWKIVSVHVNERSQEGNLYGYVVVEREIPSNQ